MKFDGNDKVTDYVNLTHIKGPSQWQPIDSAPRGGAPILGFWSYMYPEDKYPTIGIDIIEWDDSGKIEGWRDSDGVTADGVYTHWMPLPEPPQ